MKIAIFHFGFFYSGGGEKLVLEEVRSLRNSGHDVACYAPYIDRTDCYPDSDEVRRVKALLPPPPAWLPLKDALWVLACCILMPFMAPRFRSFDILLGANQPSGWFAYVLSVLLRKPYVIYLAQPLRLLHPREIDRTVGLRIRDGDQSFVRFLGSYARAIIDWADRISVRRATSVLTNGAYVARWIQDVYGTSSICCPAGCHPTEPDALTYSDRWTGQLSVVGHDIEKPYILLTNRHAPQKRFEYALWGLKSVVRHVPNIRLVITGQETQYTEQIRYLVNSLNLERNVRFVGLVSESDLQALYRGAIFYVYPSPEEDFGMGIVEAMGAGTPVVAWRSGGPTATVSHGETGFLATPHDTDDFGERMLLLAANAGLGELMGRAANRRAGEHFSYDRHGKILERVLSACLPASRTHPAGIKSLADEAGAELDASLSRPQN